ncbi:MAG TPA: GerMN domain-containing protein [Candidatus Paceibacterota bacterium]
MKNNLTQKGFIVPALIVIIALLVIGGGLYAYNTSKNKWRESLPLPFNESEKAGPDNSQEIASVDASKDISIKTFKLGTLEFSYPNNLSLKQTGDTVSLSHSIPTEKYVDSCDLKDGLTIEGVNDFNASFKIIDLDVKNSIKKDNPNMLEYIFKGDSIVTDSDTGFIIKYKMGLLDGYNITMGLEGCGVNNYYFPISSTKTLFISKSFPSQTYPDTDLPKLNKIPGYITSTQEEQIFKDILSSVTGLPNQKTMSVKVFFPNSVTDPGFMDCSIVRSTTRTIPYTLATGETSLIELIKGPTAQELSQGFQTQIDINATIKSLSIKNEIAYVDFSKELQNKNVGLCAGQFIDAQIRQTLLQFPTIKSVVISIEGNKDFVQP